MATQTRERPRRRARAAAAVDPGELARLTAASIEKEQVASVLRIDLDGLQVINSDAGREVGDRVIASAMTLLTEITGSEGWTLSRVGGDEFVLLAPGVALEAAFLRAERLRIAMNEAIATVLPRDFRCTTSVGVANAPRDATAAEELLRKSDLALYAAKEQGGDAVALTPGGEMVLKSSYYRSAQLGRLRALAERLKKKEAVLLREALDDFLRKNERT